MGCLKKCGARRRDVHAGGRPSNLCPKVYCAFWHKSTPPYSFLLLLGVDKRSSARGTTSISKLLKGSTERPVNGKITWQGILYLSIDQQFSASPQSIRGRTYQVIYPILYINISAAAHRNQWGTLSPPNSRFTLQLLAITWSSRAYACRW